MSNLNRIKKMNKTETVKSIDDLKELYKSIKYGPLNHLTGESFPLNNFEAWLKWRLNTPQETLKYRVGNCYDTALLSRAILLKLAIPHKVYHARIKYGDKQDPTHTFVLYKDSPKWKWLEGSWGPYINNTLQDRSRKRLLKAVVQKLDEAAGKLNIVWLLKNHPLYGSDMKQYLDAVLSLPLIKTESLHSYQGPLLSKEKLLKLVQLYKLLRDDQDRYLPDTVKRDGWLYQLKLIANKFKNKDTTIFTDLKNNVPRAFGLLRPYDMYLNSYGVPGLYVSLLSRGKGIGKRLLKAIEKAARERKAKTLMLGYYVDNPAKHLYDRQGFKPFAHEAYKEL